MAWRAGGGQIAALRGPTSAPEARVLPLPEGTPQVCLLDAGRAGLDQHGLREWARRLAAPAQTAHSSRSYRHPYALVACGRGPVGVDLERVEPFDPRFLDSICTPEERERPLDRDDTAVAALWSSKEALSKALGDALAYDPRRLGSPIFWPSGRSGPWRAAQLAVPEGYVGWLCWHSVGTPS